jgi:hypothetical protein
MKEGVRETFLQGRFCAKNFDSPDRRLDSSTVHSPECIASILHVDEYAQFIVRCRKRPFCWDHKAAVCKHC